MAISLNYTSSQGALVNGAYIVVTDVAYSKMPLALLPGQPSPSTRGVARVYLSAGACASGKKHFDDINFWFDADTSMTATPIYVQAYVALKALPSMAGAIDC